MFRRLAFVSLLTTVALAAGACKEDEPTDARGGARPVPASEETKQAYGVERWYVEPRDEGELWVGGVDGERNVVLELVAALKTDELAHGSVSYDVHGKMNVHVNLQWTGDDMRSNADDLTEADQTSAAELFAHLAADLEASERTLAESQVVNQSYSVSLTPQGGHVGGPLVRRQQDILREGECLLDNDGKYCSWETVKLGYSLYKTATCFRGKIWNCVLGPKDLYETAKKAEQKGCKYRPCPK